MPCRLAKLQILLINTKVPRGSKKLIAGVREKHDKVHISFLLRTYLLVVTCKYLSALCISYVPALRLLLTKYKVV